MISREFTLEDQLAFARLSGDFNPLHVEPMAARRSLFGRPVVHGIHTLLWAMDQWIASQVDTVGITSLKATFERPIGVGEEAILSTRHASPEEARLDLFSDGQRSTHITLQLTSAPDGVVSPLIREDPPRTTPREWSVDQLDSASGALELYLNEGDAQHFFPALAARLSPSRIGVLLATTRLIGMECPGLYSVFSELELVFTSQVGTSGALQYRVRRFDQRFSALTFDLRGAGVTGVIKAFVRPKPQAQPTFELLASMVGKNEFESQRAIVVGGSRGLGEATAKLLAAGGADVIVTYHRGGTDAERVVAEIVAGGGKASAIPFNVLDPDGHQLAEKPAYPDRTHLYYFATPAIVIGAKGGLHPPLFERFSHYYVTGLVNTLSAFRLPPSTHFAIFYPSTVLIDEQPAGLAEYAAAKAAGESLCHALAKHDKRLRLYTPRLPRMATDQTASLVPVHKEDAGPMMLRHIRAFHQSYQGGAH
jgi:hypothetical protein